MAATRHTISVLLPSPLLLGLLLSCFTWHAGAQCPDDPESDLCNDDAVSGAGGGAGAGELEDASAASSLQVPSALAFSFVLAPLCGNHGVWLPLLASIVGLATPATATGGAVGMTCGDVKSFYNSESCCGNPQQDVEFQIVPNPEHRLSGNNPCHDQKSLTQPGLNNAECFTGAVRDAAEQSGADVTQGFVGDINTTVTPISVPYHKTALCPVNVHWHLGAEHRSAGEYDEYGTSPNSGGTPDGREPADNNPDVNPPNRILTEARYGYACRKYDASIATHTTDYEWKHCVDMHVGETYEVHWPHSALGACGTPNQYQHPFYDGVFCGATADLITQLTPQMIADNVGVQAQVFTIINDEHYYYPDLARGMIVEADHDMGIDIAAYTGSTTGTSRNNQICSFYAPITWQVDRKCHFISASSFDKMCADMKQMRDDMSGDLHPHGARELVWQNLTANNHRDQQP